MFALDPRVASAEITDVNEALMNEGNDGPATYLPTLTPDLMSGDAPGYIELTVAPALAESINPERITYTTSANAPFSFRWVAGNDFGENGGGAAGFTTGDIVLERTPHR